VPVLPPVPVLPVASGLDAATEALAAGLPVVLPTDTVYGVAVEPTRAGATDRLFGVKERPRTAALPLLVASVDQAVMLAGDLPPAARALAAAFWPGGLTLVVPRRPGLDLDLGGEDDTTVGLRLPDHPVPVALAERVGPLAATSANLHGRPTPPSAREVAAELGDAIELVLDGGRCSGAPSTVVACTSEGVTVLREGRVRTADVFAALA
jgi:L-threonylcarbamoyladenylate synthase